MAMVDWLEMGVEGIARLTEAREGWLEVVGECDGMGLVTAVDEFVGRDIHSPSWKQPWMSLWW